MTFKPLIEENEIEDAYNSFSKSMMEDTTKFDSYLAYRRHTEKGKEEIRDVGWNEELGIWSFFRKYEKLYWCPVGVQDPSTLSQDPSKPPRLIITCLIDFPRKGINRRVNGLFVRDDKNIYVTHKCNFGGGAKGISGSSFKKSEQYKQYKKNNRIDVTWPDGKETETICIGKLKDPKLPRKVANFVEDVRRYKDDVYRKRRTPSKEAR